MQQSSLTAIKAFFIFGLPVLISLLVAFELGYFTMATKPSNYNRNGESKKVHGSIGSYLSEARWT